MQRVMVQVYFCEETKYGTYSDALYFTQDEFPLKSKNDIASLIQERIDAYIDNVENSKTPKELTKEELESAIAELDSQKAELQNKLDEI